MVRVVVGWLEGRDQPRSKRWSEESERTSKEEEEEEEEKEEEDEERERERKRKGDRSALGRAGYRHPWSVAINGEGEGRKEGEGKEREEERKEKKKIIVLHGRLIMASLKLSKIVNWPQVF